ncbi:hypothetical protein CIL05_20130 [Virgibacillus profundi]|uniref:Type I restriction modification DNA specificity domain-containing protein n=1 Tax=Virgibacillus profundi TaxID=2024555 RepID=A0A2A2I8S9_9BACI|nr:restriction endonuclease subunit S [Virgibacillus profundi]PAV27788.1 hypothetical protein CIL05_20130 [Virgibacillus profundi]PXY52010.1 restriction endonuclease subunit S [Virgibacillus profundi]
MMGEKKLVPKRRFANSTSNKSNVWRAVDLGSIANITKLAGFEFTKYVTYSNEGKIIALRGLNVKDNKIILDDVKYIDKSDFSKLSRSKLFKDDLLFTYVGTIGEMAIIPINDKYYLAPNVARIRLEEQHDANYLAQLIGSNIFYKRTIYPLIATSSQPALSMENIRKFEVTVPAYKEQQKIGEFFKILDERIANQERKIAKVKALKSAYLTDMFPQEGETIPKRRFKEFNGEWENKTLGEILDVNSGRDYKHLQKGNIPVYGTGGYMLSVNDKLSEVDGIGIGRKGTIDNPQYLKSPFWTVDTLFYMTPRYKEDLYFLFSKSKTIKWREMDESSGVPSLSKNTIEEISLAIPSYIEQQKIGTFFKNLDDQITTEEKKLEKLKKTKEAYLEEMFV